jgi:peptidyl-prolyl cis-trans isomerase B (cyclophilin B)
MKRTLFCWIAALSMGILSSHAQDSTAKKETPPTPKSSEATPPTPGAPALPTPGATTPTPKTGAAKEVAVVKTSMGEMVLEFWPEVAPKHVENFKSLAKKGFYDGTAFHRVIPNFMAQGGDPNTKDEAKKGSWGGGNPGYTIKNEFNDRKHVKGVLSMARLPSGPDTAGCQFFICLADAPHLDHQYTAFGKLIKGDDVLTKIGSTPTGPRDVPMTRVNVESIKIVGIDTIK